MCLRQIPLITKRIGYQHINTIAQNTSANYTNHLIIESRSSTIGIDKDVSIESIKRGLSVTSAPSRLLYLRPVYIVLLLC